MKKISWTDQDGKRHRTKLGEINTYLVLKIYTQEEEEFLRKVLEFRQKYKRIPTLQEGFKILWNLGYRRENG